MNALEVSWSRLITPSNHRNGAFSVCVSGDRVYAVGFDEYHGSRKMRFRIESLSIGDGKTVSVWTDELAFPFSSLFNCVSYGNRVYAFGATNRFWSILAFNRMLEFISRVNIDKPYLMPFSSIILDRYPNLFLYSAGTTVPVEGTTSMYVVKISAADFSILNSFSTDMNGAGAGAYGMGYNNTTKEIVVGGYAKTDSGLEWLLAFFNENLDLNKIVRPGIRGSIMGLTIDIDGFIYAVDGKIVAKIRPDGKVISTLEIPQASKVYASQDKTSPLAPYVVVVSDSDLYLLSREDLTEVASVKLIKEPQTLISYPGSIDVVHDNVYLALTRLESEDKWNWLVTALTLRPAKVRRFRFF